MLTGLASWSQAKVNQPTPSALSYETLVVDGLVRAGGAKLPSGEPIVSSPITSILIYGGSDAMLVDPPMSIGQTWQVVEWIASSGKHLKYIYSTHGHGDHWAGTKQILDRFPDAIPYATPGTITQMHKQVTEDRRKMFERDFPGQLGETPVLARPIPPGGLDLEGNLILPVEVGHSDTDDTTVLFVPSLGLVAAGDAVYNGVHPFLLEGGNGGLDAWLLALDKIDTLKPRIVIAGHKNKKLPDDPKTIGETRQYLLDAKRLLASRPTPLDYYQQMLVLYPKHLNPGPLWYSGVTLLGGNNPLSARPSK
jgi:glyoxylase-like metal-dependent hydrolase (beta-lactamase superfamily II)